MLITKPGESSLQLKTLQLEGGDSNLIFDSDWNQNSSLVLILLNRLKVSLMDF